MSFINESVKNKDCMDRKLFIEAITKYMLGLVIVGVLLFVPAQSFKYYNAWLFIGLLFIPMFVAGVVLMIKNPELLRKRLNSKEEQSDQKIVVLLSGLMFIGGFIVAGLNYRFNWTKLSNIVVIISSIIFLMSYVLYGEVLKENTYLSRTIEVQENQKVVDTGMYGIIRHPMYAVTVLLFLSIPLILGSIISFIIFLIYPIIIVKRIENEEMVLEKKLNGYKQYREKVKYKMIPFIW